MIAMTPPEIEIAYAIPMTLQVETKDPLPEQKEVASMDLKDETLDPIGDTVEQ